MKNSIQRNLKSSLARLTTKRLREILPKSLHESRTTTVSVSPDKFIADTSGYNIKTNLQRTSTSVKYLKHQEEPFKTFREPLSAIKIIKSKQSLRQQRINSLESLVNKCKKVREDLKQNDILIKYKKIDSSASKLKSSIEYCQNINNANIESSLLRRQSENALKNKSKLVKKELSFKDRPLSRNRCIWKISKTVPDRKADKLIEDLIYKYKLSTN